MRDRSICRCQRARRGFGMRRWHRLRRSGSLRPVNTTSARTCAPETASPCLSSPVPSMVQVVYLAPELVPVRINPEAAQSPKRNGICEVHRSESTRSLFPPPFEKSPGSTYKTLIPLIRCRLTGYTSDDQRDLPLHFGEAIPKSALSAYARRQSKSSQSSSSERRTVRQRRGWQRTQYNCRRKCVRRAMFRCL